MTLTNEQINELFTFTEKKLVRYYDLQVELVDHLAERIEEEMTLNEKLGFEKALQKVYAEFGLFGFAKIVQEKAEAVRKRNLNLWWNNFKQFFTFPKLIATITLLLLGYYFGQLLSSAFRSYSLFATWAIFSLYQFYLTYRISKRTKKKVLLLQVQPVTATIGPVMMYEQFLFLSSEITSNLIFTTAFVSTFIIQSVVLEVSKKVRTEAESLYPEAFQKA